MYVESVQIKHLHIFDVTSCHNIQLELKDKYNEDYLWIKTHLKDGYVTAKSLVIDISPQIANKSAQEVAEFVKSHLNIQEKGLQKLKFIIK